VRKLARKTWFLVLALIAIAALTSMLVLALFEPPLDYDITQAPRVALESEEFLKILQVLADAQLYRKTRIDVLTNADAYYPAEIQAIRNAAQSVNLEAYIFSEGQVTRRFVEALTERANAGVRVNVVLDAVGSLRTSADFLRPLTDAKGHVAFYHPLRWYTWPRYNNRTHRELMIVDGRIGFVGGSGFADHWLYPHDGNPPWRDTMFRVEGDAVAGLQSSFVENWVEASGQILTSKEYFPFEPPMGDMVCLVINSSPSAGRSTRARMIFQTLLASARESIHINTPYFLPDKSVREEMARAVNERGVDLKIVVPGRHNDHAITRRSSRALYGDILRAGGQIYEYQPGMMHAKIMIIDGLWSVVGTTNFDNRSFGLNDEVNVAARDIELASRLERDFQSDLRKSRLITYEQWQRRPFWERLQEKAGSLIERQQ
jgi:cardiolipin synthase